MTSYCSFDLKKRTRDIRRRLKKEDANEKRNWFRGLF